MLRDIAQSYADAVYVALLMKPPERPSLEERGNADTRPRPPSGFTREADAEPRFSR